VVLLAVPAGATADHPAGQKKGEFNENAVPKGVQQALGGDVEALPGGGYRVDAKVGPDLYTHGPDPVTPALSGGEAPKGDPFGHTEPEARRFGSGTELAPACVQPSEANSDYYQHVLYGFDPGNNNFDATMKSDIQKEIAQMNFVLNRDSNASSGGAVDASFKVLCDGTGSTTSDIQVDTFANPNANTFNGVSSAARTAGFNKQNVDYTIFYDGGPSDGNYCGVGGFFSDQTPSASNANNLGNTHGITWNFCWDGITPMHENGHNQGAVQRNGRHSTGTGAHCYDDFDVMCYNDGGDLDPGPPLATSDCGPAAPGAAFTDVYDCGFNTYFDTLPGAGSYLATNWNIGSAANRFIERDTGTTPTNDPPQAAFTHSCDELDCDFTDQSSDSDGTVDDWEWSFGDSEESTAQSPSHVFDSPGNYTVTLIVTDNDGASDTVSIPIQVSDADGNFTQLFNNQIDFRTAGPQGDFDRYGFFVPRNRSKLVVSIVGEPCDYIAAEDICRPDLDLYVKRGFHPEEDFFDCRPFLYGITETCKIKNPRKGAYGIGVHNYAATPGEPYTIKARHVR
jgi:PKD repeat protein